MAQRRSIWYYKLGLVSGLAITGALTFSGSSALAQIIKDNTLGSENSVITPKLINGQLIDQIDGGVIRGTNLFHSFEQFSVLPGSTAYFNNAANIQNIISRVTGKSVSNIDGIIKANGTANLFLINPNGIIFGRNASLNIRGSFIASTASSLNFADGTKFSATDPQTPPLLIVSVPTGLQFGATAAPILNQSQASPNGATNSFNQPVGLQVQSGKTLALVGGDITLEGGNLTAASGRIELGSVASNSLVSLKPTDQDWSVGYEGVQNFQNIRLIRRTDNGSAISSTVDASNQLGSGGRIQVQSNTVELIGPRVRLATRTGGDGNGEDLTITTRKLIVEDGAQVFTSTIGKGKSGNLIVNASESVEIIGSVILPDSITGLLSSTVDQGNAGDITINTKILRIQEGAKVSAESTAKILPNSQVSVAEGNGGNLTVNASESVEVIGTSATGNPSELSALTQSFGKSGTVTITTGQLIVRDGAAITVNSQLVDHFNSAQDGRSSGKAGDLNINARSILLDNQGQITSNSQSGKGGNISLQVRDLLLMRRNSQISTNGGSDKTGGNITINAPNGFLVATPFGNNDITANANFGSGGKITITAKNIFGFVPRTGTDVERLDPTGETNPKNLETSDITAFSQQNPSLNGTVQINSPDTDPSKGLVELPVNLVDASQQIAASCSSGGKIARNSFITTGRGGLVADPTEPLIADDAVLADWIALPPESQNRAGGIKKRAVVQAQRHTEKKSQKVNYVNEPTQIVEAQGWVMDANGNVVLVAQVPTESPHNSSLTATSCAAH
ncbi:MULTISPECIES: two-partner secretion domain-containing protein [unclassified Nostoc]|uniref:two-partner secretion domain-containing protein n=1 Tax=unclassified Nostoc TaxID=2593658 RepID=UPI0025EB664B|nr:filamentous hemagglutinin N-terminal domain-containing protein [Nostoc sp. JL31]MBN3889863.1 filamentous hemagglutinin N-terminal domain-containing protein [Nostoc sp. JL31]